jgi:hypothetical protein
MTQYIIAYIGGRQPETPEEGQAHFQKWQQWLTDLGPAVVNPGTPLSSHRLVSKDGVSEREGDPQRLTGFSMVEADSLEAAIEMARACPFLDMGDLQVSQVMQMG